MPSASRTVLFLPLLMLPALPLLTDVLSAQSPEPVAVKPRYVPPVITDSAGEPDTMTVESTPDQPPNCWRAQPAPICPGYFLTDFGLEVPLVSTRSRDPRDGSRRGDLPFRATWTIGLMGSRGRHSHGASVGAAMEENASVVPVLEYRYRRWLDRSAAFDVGAGVRRATLPHPTTGRINANGITLMAGYTPNRWIAATLRYDHVHGQGRTGRALMLGAQSTRASEFMFRRVAIGLVQMLFEAIGGEFEVEDEQ